MQTADADLGWVSSQGRWVGHFSQSALAQVADLAGPLLEVAARSVVPDGGVDQPVFLVAEGWSYSYVDFSDGRRYVVDVHVPGDAVGMAEACGGRAVPRLGTLTPVTAARLDGTALQRRLAGSVDLAVGMSRLLAAQQADLTDHTGSLARHTAYERVAALLLRLYRRVEQREPTGGTAFDCPVSQQVMADMLGLSVVHVNRSLRRLAEDGVLRKRAHDVEILDGRALQQSAQM